MILGIYYELNIKVEFQFSPLFELLASLHVLANPVHHLSRQSWVQEAVSSLPKELLTSLNDYASCTKQWLILMDFCYDPAIRDLPVLDALDELEQSNLSLFHKIFKPYEKSITRQQKTEILFLLRRYYSKFFYREMAFLEPFIKRALSKELELCKTHGILNRLNKLHERLIASEQEIILYKNKEYHFLLSQLKKISLTGSTFMSPHLLMGTTGNTLLLTKLICVEDRKDSVPDDLVLLFKALGDENRLKILREIKKKPASTQSLALKLSITEAGVSKHLKLLAEAKLVFKERNGNYIYYHLNPDAIDYLPYQTYEFLS